MTARKTCVACRVSKPLDRFYVRDASPDGRQQRCKPCDNARRMGHWKRGTGAAGKAAVDVRRMPDGSLVMVRRA